MKVETEMLRAGTQHLQPPAPIIFLTLFPLSFSAITPGVMTRSSREAQGTRDTSSRLDMRSGEEVGGAPACSGTCLCGE